MSLQYCTVYIEKTTRNTIIADIIIRLFPQLDEHLEPNGTLLTSGIIEDRIDDVINAGQENGFAVVKRKENKGWACITFKRANEI